MSVFIKATPFRPEMFGAVVDMPTPHLLLVQTSHGVFTIHDTEVREYIYA